MTDHEPAPDVQLVEDASAAEEPARKWYLTPRQTFGLIAVVLALALIALLILLLLLLAPGGFTRIVSGEGEGELRALLVIEGPGTGETPTFSRPMGVAFAPNGDIYVSDTGNNRITVFSARGAFKSEFGGFGVAKPADGFPVTWEEGLLNFPLGMDIADDGTVYVADFENDSISVFDADGAFLRRFPDPNEVTGKGGSGKGGRGIAVTDVAVAGETVYALDSFQVLVFTTEGELLGQFGRPGLGEGDLDRPNGIEVGFDGTIYVSDSNHNRVVAFDREGDVLWSLGRPVTEIARQTTYEFGLPRGIALTPDDRLLVVDAFEFDIVEVSTDGEVLGRYGDRGVEPARFNFPNGIDVRGRRIVVADKENDRVQVLELLR